MDVLNQRVVELCDALIAELSPKTRCFGVGLHCLKPEIIDGEEYIDENSLYQMGRWVSTVRAHVVLLRSVLMGKVHFMLPPDDQAEPRFRLSEVKRVMQEIDPDEAAE